MRAIRSKGMLPELTVRRLVHKMGYRFRLHGEGLPGRPDIVFASRRKIIYVHGCFWHSHGCKLGHIPKSNRNYWVPKLRRNRERDRKNLATLKRTGWDCMVLWECETRDQRAVQRQIKKFLRGQHGR